MGLKDIIFIVTFIVSLPLCWYVLLASRLDEAFKKGKVWQIRTAFILLTIIFAFFLASAISTFASLFQIK